jgi:hypothetical protein
MLRGSSFRASASAAVLALLVAACGGNESKPEIARNVGRAADDPVGPATAEEGPAATAPEWVRAGVRLTFWAGAVTIEGTGEAIYVEDPAGPFRDYEGRTYRLESGTKDRTSGDNAAGHGYMQVDVVGAVDDRVYMLVRGLVMTDVNVPPVLIGIQGLVADRATGGGLWAPVAALAQARSTKDRKVLVGPYPRGGQVYDAAVFSEGTTSRVYDRKTGILLVERMSAQSQRGWVNRNGWFLPAPPRTSGSLMTFEGTRTLQVPWPAADAPPAAHETDAMRFSGGTTVMVVGSGAMTIPSSLSIRRTATHGGVMEYVYAIDQPAISVQPAQHTEFPMVATPLAIGGPWLAELAIASLQKGQRLDQDPVAGSTLSVTHAGRTLLGRDVVTLTERSRAFTMEWSYDRATGLLRSVRLDQPAGVGMTSYHYDRRD